jgi:LVIVD repeat-containing protein
MSKSALFKVLVGIAAVVLALPAVAAGQPRTGSIRQVGHEPLMNRGMNAAIAVHGDYAYIGSRTDGSHVGQPHGGIMVVDISRPRRPELVTETPIDAKPGESSRELRVWRSQDILIVLNTNCGAGPTLHHCSLTDPEARNFRFYDISGQNARRPRLITQMDEHTHEFFLWEDPNNPTRALIFGGNAGSTCGEHPTPSCPFAVWDISPVLEGEQPETLYSNLHGFTRFPADPALPVQKPTGGLHSLSVSNDGTRAYFALLTGGFGIVDTSDFARDLPSPQPRPITFNESRPTWRGPGAHSAIKLWGRDWAWVSDEVYGTATGSAHGCPWGWARLVDITDPTRPTVEAAYRIDENDPDTCEAWNPPRTSYSAHNPTLTPSIAFSTWHSGGLQAVNITKPWQPDQLAEFFPRPLREVMLEDPRLSSDPDTGRNEKVVMWSYPIIKDGLIYVVDLRNGLYVLDYNGRFEREVERIGFLEGNSNQGDALCFEPVGTAPSYCDDD